MKLKELINIVENDFAKKQVPVLQVGDTVKVGVLIQEGNKQRVQPYEGTVIARRRAGINTTITVRRVFQGIGVERIFVVHSPLIKDIEVLKSAKVRRAKLYFLRDRIGKGTRLTRKLN
jgi:large subunit ribosomal protein L19